MKKAYLMVAVATLSGSLYAGCGSGCFNNCEGPQVNPGRPGTCGVQGVRPDVREYRANPNQGVYSTGDGPGYPQAGSPQGGMKQGAWQNNNPQQRSQDYDAMLYQDVANALKGYNLSINVRGGVVTLQGRVRSEEEKKSIGDRINAMKTVKRVNNQLEVWNDTTNPLQRNK